MLLGSCDDLSIPRPLGPLRDLAGHVSPELERALSAGDASHEIHGLLIEELGLPPRPTVLVVEDVHWADDATLDAITVLVRRIGTLPALVVLTCRDGELTLGHPLHATFGSARPDDLVFMKLDPCLRSAVSALAGGDAGETYAVTRGNPFYVTELLASRASPTCRSPSRTPCSGVRRAWTTPHAASSSSSPSSRTVSGRRCSTR